MTAAAYQAWLSLYLATSIVAALCAVLAAAKTVIDLRSHQIVIPTSRKGDKLLAIPRVWLAWQVNYLRGAPVVLAICGFYAYHLGFGVLGQV